MKNIIYTRIPFCVYLSSQYYLLHQERDRYKKVRRYTFSLTDKSMVEINDKIKITFNKI